MKGTSITPDHAQKIRQAVVTLTGIPYTGQFALTQEQPVANPSHQEGTEKPHPVERQAESVFHESL